MNNIEKFSMTLESEGDFKFADIFNLEDIQHLQDLFADATGVASIITFPDGKPITQPSNFSRMCSQIIRKTELGLANCMYSDAQIGRNNPSGPIVKPCLSCGLWDAGASITVGGKHIANWLIGQIRNESTNQEQLINYADEIGANRKDFIEAFAEIPVMSHDQFQKVSEMLFAFANELSEKAFKNYQLKAQGAEREKAYSLLKESEEKFSAIFENVQDVFYQTDLDGIVTEISPSIKHFSEFNRDEIIGINVSNLYYNPDDRSILLDKITKYGELLDYEITLKTKTGNKKFVSINARLVYDTKGKPTHIDGALRDITERKQQETEYKQLIDAMNDTAFVINFEGKFIETNDTAVNVLGYSREELLNMSVTDIDPRLTEIEIMSLIEGMKLWGRQVFETQHQTKTGKIISVEISSSPVFFHGKAAILSVARDITERKHAVETIQLARQSYFDIFNSVSEAIYIQDEKGTFIDVNLGAEKIYGCSRDYLIGKNPADVAAPGRNDLDEIIKLSHEVFETGIPAQFIFWAVRANGEVFPKEVIVNKGKYFGKDVLIATARDITLQKKTEELIRESEENYRLLAENATDVIWTMDIEGKYNYVSPSVYALRGITAEENMKETMLEGLTPDSAELVIKMYKEYSVRILNGEKNPPVTIELEQLCKNGGTVWTEINISAIYDVNDKFKYFLGVTRDISKRRETEKALRHSEKRKEDILKALPDLLFLFNQKGDYLEVITGDNATLGHNKDEITGKNIADFLPAQIAAEALIAFDECLFRKEPVQFSYSLTINGEKHFYETRLIPTSDSKILAIVRDLTELKIAESHRDKQLLYTKALNEVAEIIISNDNAVEILEETNAVVGRTLQLDRSLIYNVSFEKNIITGLSEWLRTEHPDIKATKGEYPLDLFLSPFNEIMKTRKHLESHFDQVGESFQKDGSGKILHEHFKIKSLIWYPFFFNENGFHVFTLNQILEPRQWTQEEFGFLESVVKQVTLALIKIQLLHERQLADDRLQTSYDMLNRLAAQVPGVVYQYRLYPDGRSAFPYSSPGMYDIYGVTPEEVRLDATPVFSRIHPDDFDMIVETINESARNQTRYHSEFRVILPEQGLRWRLCDAKPELLEDGSTLWYGIISDITDRKKAEEELVKAKERAEESDRLKSAFLANMSHEIRTPMNGILGFADLLKEPDLSGDEQQKYIGIIEKSGARMLNIINDIISISKIESGQMEINISATNINDQTEYIYNFFRPEAEQKGLLLSLKNRLSPEESILKTDREKLYAILTNLVKNAIKYTNTGSVEFGYDSVKPHNGEPSQITFFIKDTGIGVPKDRQQAIFDRFVQADIEDKKALQGAGLGLSITKAYVEMLGGNIWVESEEGKGSCFYFTLPFTIEPGKMAETETLHTSTENDMPAQQEIAGLKILIAEDDETSEMLLEISIRPIAKQILVVKKGTEAIEICKNNPDIDLVLMDIMMPDMDGYEATTEIRKFNSKVVIIAQTAYGLAGDREKAIAAGCNDYFSKPIRIEKLLKKISDLFNIQ